MTLASYWRSTNENTNGTLRLVEPHVGIGDIRGGL
jgi:hypothetical protein